MALMDPVTLHFNVWQAGAHQRSTTAVDDPRGTTILALKRQLFPDALKASKTVRFIASGKILQDTSAVESCGLGREAHVHVSISEPSVSSLPSVASSDGNTSSTQASATRASSDEQRESLVSWAFIGCAALFIGTGVGLFVALRKRWQFTMHTSQLIFICAAVWAYLLLFHGLPSLIQVVMKLGSASGPKDNVQDTSTWGTAPTTGASMDEASTEATSSTPPAQASSAGLSLMTPTMPPGDTASSVLTQRSAAAAATALG